MNLLFLGAGPSQAPIIEAARKRRYRVLTTDNRPTNPGHQLADRAFDVSTVDVDGLRALIRAEKVDFAFSYASDHGCKSIAVLAPEFGWSFPSASTIRILTDKTEFRRFLADRDLQPLPFLRVNAGLALAEVQKFAVRHLPVIVKPVDGNGSKGVTIVRSLTGTAEALALARESSPSATVIVESFLTKEGPQICGDGFFDGQRVTFLADGDGYHYEQQDLKVPYAESFPSSHSPALIQALREKIERILVALDDYHGTFNFDAIAVNGQPFVIEIAPRSGGNFLSQAIELQSGIDLTDIALQCFLDPDLTVGAPSKRGFSGCFMLHSMQNGTYEGYELSPEIRPNVKTLTEFVPVGSLVYPFLSGDRAVGHALLEFGGKDEMLDKMSRINDLIKVRVSGAAVR